MSICGSLVDCLIEDTVFSNTGADGYKTAPACGIDIEPDADRDPEGVGYRNFTMRNVRD